jgi:hypothetical protein
MARQRAQLAGEREQLVGLVVVEWLLAEAVARQQQAAAARVEHDESEHAVQTSGELGAPLLVAVHQHFGVGMVGTEHVAAPLELPAQLNVVIDLAVEDDTDSRVLVPHRLHAAGRVADGEPLVPEINRLGGVDMDAVLVRPAVNQRARHRDQIVPIAAPDEARDPAH